MRFLPLRVALVAAAAVAARPASGDLTPGQLAQLPPSAARAVAYREDVRPILVERCHKCHGGGASKGGLRLDTRALLFKGGESGPAVIPGNSAASRLIELVMGFDRERAMPEKGPRLSREQIGVLRAWIDQGLDWEAEADARPKFPEAPLAPRRPELPAGGPPGEHPIDALLRPHFARNGFVPPAPVEDRRFARRVWRDVVGLLPPPAELEAFAADAAPDKRARLVRRLLDDHRGYAEHGMSFWNDLLRNDYVGAGYIDGGRQQITPWLYAALAANRPFDRFVAELVHPSDGSKGFSKGIVWRGATSAGQTPPMQAAQAIAQVFLGINLKCASCHDSFVSNWKLQDAYGLASVYAEKGPLELVRCDAPTGEKAEVRFLFPELGAIDAAKPVAERTQQLAAIVTARGNGRLTRTIVNRLWARCFGRGLVEPVDEMDNEPWERDLLDWLAEDLADNGYDLKRTLERMLTSQAYQLPAVPGEERRTPAYAFRGPEVRRMSAEQFIDAVLALAGLGHEVPAASVDFTAGGAPLDEAAADLEKRLDAARWVRGDPSPEAAVASGAVFLRRVVEVPEVPVFANVIGISSNAFTLFVNGKEALKSEDFTTTASAAIRPHLVKGRNVLAIKAVNGPANPAAVARVALYAMMRRGGDAWDVATDPSWRWSATAPAAGWEKDGFDDSSWAAAADAGPVTNDAWLTRDKFRGALRMGTQYGRVRSWLVTADPLAVALGRPNREQIVTTRPSAATTLQALELTNGRTLAGMLRRAAEKLVREEGADATALTDRIYARALGRAPSGAERGIARDVTGTPATVEGVEDLLWIVVQLPEFQLVY